MQEDKSSMRDRYAQEDGRRTHSRESSPCIESFMVINLSPSPKLTALQQVTFSGLGMDESLNGSVLRLQHQTRLNTSRTENNGVPEVVIEPHSMNRVAGFRYTQPSNFGLRLPTTRKSFTQEDNQLSEAPRLVLDYHHGLVDRVGETTEIPFNRSPSPPCVRKFHEYGSGSGAYHHESCSRESYPQSSTMNEHSRRERYRQPRTRSRSRSLSPTDRRHRSHRSSRSRRRKSHRNKDASHSRSSSEGDGRRRCHLYPFDKQKNRNRHRRKRSHRHRSSDNSFAEECKKRKSINDDNGTDSTVKTLSKENDLNNIRTSHKPEEFISVTRKDVESTSVSSIPSTHMSRVTDDVFNNPRDPRLNRKPIGTNQSAANLRDPRLTGQKSTTKDGNLTMQGSANSVTKNPSQHIETISSGVSRDLPHEKSNSEDGVIEKTELSCFGIQNVITIPFEVPKPIGGLPPISELLGSLNDPRSCTSPRELSILTSAALSLQPEVRAEAEIQPPVDGVIPVGVYPDSEFRPPAKTQPPARVHPPSEIRPPGKSRTPAKIVPPARVPPRADISASAEGRPPTEVCHSPDSCLPTEVNVLSDVHPPAKIHSLAKVRPAAEIRCESEDLLSPEVRTLTEVSPPAEVRPLTEDCPPAEVRPLTEVRPPAEVRPPSEIMHKLQQLFSSLPQNDIPKRASKRTEKQFLVCSSHAKILIEAVKKAQERKSSQVSAQTLQPSAISGSIQVGTLNHLTEQHGTRAEVRMRDTVNCGSQEIRYKENITTSVELSQISMSKVCKVDRRPMSSTADLSQDGDNELLPDRPCKGSFTDEHLQITDSSRKIRASSSDKLMVPALTDSIYSEVISAESSSVTNDTAENTSLLPRTGLSSTSPPLNVQIVVPIDRKSAQSDQVIMLLEEPTAAVIPIPSIVDTPVLNSSYYASTSIDTVGTPVTTRSSDTSAHIDNCDNVPIPNITACESNVTAQTIGQETVTEELDQLPQIRVRSDIFEADEDTVLFQRIPDNSISSEWTQLNGEDSYQPLKLIHEGTLRHIDHAIFRLTCLANSMRSSTEKLPDRASEFSGELKSHLKTACNESKQLYHHLDQMCLSLREEEPVTPQTTVEPPKLTSTELGNYMKLLIQTNELLSSMKKRKQFTLRLIQYRIIRILRHFKCTDKFMLHYSRKAITLDIALYTTSCDGVRRFIPGANDGVMAIADNRTTGFLGFQKLIKRLTNTTSMNSRVPTVTTETFNPASPAITSVDIRAPTHISGGSVTILRRHSATTDSRSSRPRPVSPTASVQRQTFHRMPSRRSSQESNLPRVNTQSISEMETQPSHSNAVPGRSQLQSALNTPISSQTPLPDMGIVEIVKKNRRLGMAKRFMYGLDSTVNATPIITPTVASTTSNLNHTFTPMTAQQNTQPVRTSRRKSSATQTTQLRCIVSKPNPTSVPSTPGTRRTPVRIRIAPPSHVGTAIRSTPLLNERRLIIRPNMVPRTPQPQRQTPIHVSQIQGDRQTQSSSYNLPNFAYTTVQPIHFFHNPSVQNQQIRNPVHQVQPVQMTFQRCPLARPIEAATRLRPFIVPMQPQGQFGPRLNHLNQQGNYYRGSEQRSNEIPQMNNCHFNACCPCTCNHRAPPSQPALYSLLTGHPYHLQSCPRRSQNRSHN